jgi:hypothetical protein
MPPPPQEFLQSVQFRQGENYLGYLPSCFSLLIPIQAETGRSASSAMMGMVEVPTDIVATSQRLIGFKVEEVEDSLATARWHSFSKTLGYKVRRPEGYVTLRRWNFFSRLFGYKPHRPRGVRPKLRWRFFSWVLGCKENQQTGELQSRDWKFVARFGIDLEHIQELMVKDIRIAIMGQLTAMGLCTLYIITGSTYEANGIAQWIDVTMKQRKDEVGPMAPGVSGTLTHNRITPGGWNAPPPTMNLDVYREDAR